MSDPYALPAIIGSTGPGKSAIASLALLLRYSKRQYSLDAQNIAAMPPGSRRSAILLTIWRTAATPPLRRAAATSPAGRTSFVIAHRLSTIRDAACILVMEHGTMIEQENHEELMRKTASMPTFTTASPLQKRAEGHEMRRLLWIYY